MASFLVMKLLLKKIAGFGGESIVESARIASTNALIMLR